MNYRIVPSDPFKREAKRFLKHYASFRQDLKALNLELIDNPTAGISLGKGLRKVRMNIRSKGKGKSGGARVITFTVIISVEETEINLLFIYDKSERSTISEKELTALLKESGLL